MEKVIVAVLTTLLGSVMNVSSHESEEDCAKEKEAIKTAKQLVLEEKIPDPEKPHSIIEL